MESTSRLTCPKIHFDVLWAGIWPLRYTCHTHSLHIYMEGACGHNIMSTRRPAASLIHVNRANSILLTRCVFYTFFILQELYWLWESCCQFFFTWHSLISIHISLRVPWIKIIGISNIEIIFIITMHHNHQKHLYGANEWRSDRWGRLDFSLPPPRSYLFREKMI